MNMIEKIQQMMDEEKLTKADVSKETGIPYTTFDGLFKKNFENAKLPTVRRLALFFDVSLDYLVDDDITDRNFGKYIHPFSVTTIELNLLQLWRKLSHDAQMKMLGRIEAVVEEQEG